MNSPIEKLLRKKFKIKTEDELFQIIDKKDEAFFKANFFLSKKEYLEKIKKLITQINSEGIEYSELLSMTSGDSILGSWGKSQLAHFRIGYAEKRKTFENHVQFFKKNHNLKNSFK